MADYCYELEREPFKNLVTAYKLYDYFDELQGEYLHSGQGDRNSMVDTYLDNLRGEIGRLENLLSPFDISLAREAVWSELPVK